MLNLPQRLQEEHLLTSLTRLAAKFPAHQVLACQKALLELKLCKPEDAVATVLPFTTEATHFTFRRKGQHCCHCVFRLAQLQLQ